MAPRRRCISKVLCAGGIPLEGSVLPALFIRTDLTLSEGKALLFLESFAIVVAVVFVEAVAIAVVGEVDVRASELLARWMINDKPSLLPAR
jgi:hypothetical protein